MTTIVIKGNQDSHSRRGRRTYDEDEEDDRSSQRRARRQQRDSDDEEESRSSRRSRQRENDDEEEDERPRRGRRNRDEEDSGSSRAVNSSGSSEPGATLGAMPEAKRKRIQQAIIDGMFKYAESKYGKKRKQKAGKGRSAKEEYELYIKSVKARVKTADDKLNVLLKQQAELDEKVRVAENEKKKQDRVFREAEQEKDAAESEDRDPVPPSSWVPPPLPNQGGNKKARANFASLVMSASSASWDEKFAAMKAKKGEEKQPEWMKKTSSRKRDDLMSVGKKKERSKKDHQEPAWSSAGLKKSHGEKKEIHPHHVEKAKPEWSKKSLTKEKHQDGAEDKENDGRRQRRTTRRRGGDDSD